MKDFLKELRRRHIFRVTLTYLVVAWLLIQVVNNITEPLSLPAWMPAFVIVLLGLGFPVALVIAWAFDPPQKAEAAEGGTRKPPVPPLGRKWDFVIIAGLVAALGYSYWGPAIIGDDTAPTAPVTSAEASVAVLPFANLSSNPEQEYFADGVSEEILNSLARIDDLKVAGRTSSFFFKGKDQDLRTIGEKLNVAHILEGSVRRAGDQIRVTAQLINAETGYHLWSETYERALDDVFAIQDDIANAVADTLQVTLGVGELGRQPGMTRNVEAYDAFLRGRPNLVGTVSEVRDSIAALERAVDLDPSFAQAWAWLANAYGQRRNLADPANIEEWQKKSVAALTRAQEAAPESALVLADASGLARQQGDVMESLRLIQRARKLHGDNAPAVNLARRFGGFLMNAGKHQEAIDHFLRARRIDPLDPDVSFQLGEAYLATGQLDKAVAEFDRLETMGRAPTFALRTSAVDAAWATAERAEIERRLDALLESDFAVTPFFRAIRPHIDDPKAGLAEVRRFYSDPKSSIVVKVTIARWAAYFGDPELALTIFREAYSLGFGVGFVWWPGMRDMRQLPGFKDFVRDAGLVEYWRETGWGDFCQPVGERDFECD